MNPPEVDQGLARVAAPADAELEDLIHRLTRATARRRKLTAEGDVLREEAALYARSAQEIPPSLSAQLRRVATAALRTRRHEGELRGHLYAALGDAFPEEPRAAMTILRVP